ncbi:DUF2087 domain-containing protein [Streptomyces sp. NPDC085931]|uniref:DUF2087 domain-containing protein n=1 Tax=Streptomyces sp. NPDC085931 TaxID=3365740 RepID=UPI0037D5D06A
MSNPRTELDPVIPRFCAQTGASLPLAWEFAWADQPDEAVVRPTPPPCPVPSKQGKRRMFLEGLVPLFAPRRRYPETEVNDILREVHPDVAALRRYLVEERLLMRADGHYWRP